MRAAATADAGTRRTLYGALTRRNRFVGLLRLAVPAAGLLVFLVFAGEIFLAGLKNQFGIGNVSFAGNTVTVDTPSYSGVMENGDVYTVSADEARTAISAPDIIDLDNFKLLLERVGGKRLTAGASHGAFQTSTQVLRVPGSASIADSDGNSGEVNAVTVNLAAQTLVAEGPVTITTDDGTTIAAAGLEYAAAIGRWNFVGRTTVTVPQLPGDAETGATP